MALRHLFAKKVNMNQCFGIKEHYGKHECKHLERMFINGGMSRLLFCKHRDIRLKHSDKKIDCTFYEEPQLKEK